MIKVLYISHFSHLRMGGQRSMTALIQNLDRSKITPLVIVPEDGELKAHLENINCRVYNIPLTSLKPKNIIIFISNLIKIVRIIKKEKIDILHPDHERDAFLCSIAKKFVKVKLVWHVRLTRKNNLDDFIAKNADSIIAISEGTKKRFDNKYHNKIKVIFNGVDCEKFNPAGDKSLSRTKIGIARDKFPVLFAGQIDPGKGVEDLLDAIKIIKDKKPPVNFIFIFAGRFKNDDYEKKFFEKVKDFAVEDLIFLAGQQENIEQWMQASEILILPSHEGVEGMGRVLFEAMACETTVIGTDISGVREAVFEDAGLLIPQKDPRSISHGILDISSNIYKLRNYQKKGRKIAIEHFDIKTHAMRVSDVYKQVVEEK